MAKKKRQKKKGEKKKKEKALGRSESLLPSAPYRQLSILAFVFVIWFCFCFVPFYFPPIRFSAVCFHCDLFEKASQLKRSVTMDKPEVLVRKEVNKTIAMNSEKTATD